MKNNLCEMFWLKNKTTDVIKLLASGKYPSVTTAVMWTLLFGRLNYSLIDLVDQSDEDTNIIRVIKGCNTELLLPILHDHLVEYVMRDIMEDLGTAPISKNYTKEEILTILTNSD